MVGAQGLLGDQRCSAGTGFCPAVIFQIRVMICQLRKVLKETHMAGSLDLFSDRQRPKVERLSFAILASRIKKDGEFIHRLRRP